MYQSKNNIIFLFEQVERYSLTEIKKGLGSLYEYFLENGYLSITNKAVRFSYTGIAANATNIFCILPKYLHTKLNNEKDYIFQAKQLIKVLKIYKNNINLDILDSDLINYSSHGINSEISLADFILNDYLQNGLWSLLQKNIINNLENEILWDHTIENSYPVISKYPYYFEAYSAENLFITNNVISKIHNWAVNYCTDKYSELLDIYLIKEPSLVLEDIGEKSFLLNAIDKELRITFHDRDIILLKALAELINASGSYGENVYTLYGKNKFEHIWEAGVSFCFKNQYHIYKRFLSHPKWINNLGTIVSEKKTVRPDVIRWIKNDEKSLFIIIDAKYYLFKFNDINNKAENNPGVDDIIKQYFYEFILERKTSLANWSLYPTQYINLLAFPNSNNSDELMKIIGSVSLDNSVITKPIVNIYINPELLFDCYIRQCTFTELQISEMATNAINNYYLNL